MRLLARIYSDGNTPSKASFIFLRDMTSANVLTVVAELYEAQVHGQISLEQTYYYQVN